MQMQISLEINGYCPILKKEQLMVLQELSHMVQSGMSREGKAK